MKKNRFYIIAFVLLMIGLQCNGQSYQKTDTGVKTTVKSINFEIDLKEKGNNLLLKSEKLQVSVDLMNGAISFISPSGESLLKEKESSSKFTTYNDAGQTTFSVSQSFVLDKQEAIYGLGILQNGKMVQRNLEVYMIQNNTQDFVPFFQSAKGYGLFWDNYSPTTFSDNQE